MQAKYLIYTVVVLGLIGLGARFWSSGTVFDIPAVPPAASLPSIDNSAAPFATPDTYAAIDATIGNEPARAPTTAVQEVEEVARVNTPLGQLNGLLAAGRYAEAAELYGDLYSQLSEAESQQYRKVILTFAEGLAARGQHDALADLMSKYTHLFFKDLPALRLLADSLHTLKRYPAEVEAILLALNEAHLEQDIIEFRQKLENSVAAQDLLFIQRNDPDGAVRFHQSLALARPASVPFQIGLARAMLNAGDIDAALSVLEVLPDNTEFAGQIDRLRQMAEATRPAQASAIPLSRAGSSFVVEAVVNGGATVRLLVDTGATLTIIRPAALQGAGVGPGKVVGETTLDTAGGKVSASIYGIDTLRLGPEVVANVKIGSVEIPGLGNIDGLLGMNVLSKFRFAIDQTQPVLLLTR